MTRKHFELSIPTGDGKQQSSGRKFSETDSNLIQTIKLELEVKQLKERLNATEKDLIDQRDRHCHSCTAGANQVVAAAAAVGQVAIEHHSVGIQSNLVDTKDVDEKEVQTSIDSQTKTPPRLSPTPPILSPSPTRQPQLPPLPPVDYISKSDLDAILREQREQFDSWKSIERQKFNQEIESVRKSLTETIQELEKRDRTTPPPPAQVVTIERNTEQDDNIWKRRYHELELMYENSQRQVRETIENIESAYGEKLKQFERLMDRKEETAPVSVASAPKVAPRLPHKPTEKLPIKALVDNLEKQIPVRNVSKSSVVESNESDVDEDIQQHDSPSEEDEQTESDEEIRSLEAARAKLLARINVVSPPVVAAQQGDIPAKAPKKPLNSPRRQILNTFKHRLKALGIDPKANTLPKDDLDAATEALAERRDTNKKKHKSFFITRKQLAATVDQITKGKMGEPRFAKPKVDEKTKPVPTLRLSYQASDRKSSLDLLPSRMKLASSLGERQIDQKQPAMKSNIFKAKSTSAASSSAIPALPEVTLTSDDIITVQAEIHTVTEVKATSPVLSDHAQTLERLLETPVKRVGTPPDVIASAERGLKETNESDISDILEAVPLQPKPIPKKRVLFNLNNSESTEKERYEVPTSSADKPFGPTLSSTAIEVSKVDEESDWNISSFEEEK
ncbi:cilium assembly protein DZIP1L isoform X2 [Toxorhynchites rutilus septentrionalis]|nr:cilium assembly protein DZIP1L isoform X2 [Toxorhynchites rutilus septentrionalis]